MSRNRIALWTVAAVLAVAPVAVSYGQDAATGAERPRRQAREGGERGPRAEGRQRGNGPFADLNLTEEQQQKVREVMQAHREAVKNFMQDNAEAIKAARQKMGEARKAKDEAAAKAAGEELKAIMDKRPKFEDMLGQLKGVLTDEQIAQLKANAPDRPQGPRGEGEGPRGDRGPGQIIEKLGLSPEQAEKVKAILQGHHEAAQKYRQANAEALRAAMQKMRQARQAGDEEATKAAREELAKLREAGPGREALLNDLAGVLTEEQLAKFKELAADRPRGPRAEGDRPQRPNRNRQGADRPERPRRQRDGANAPTGDAL